MDPLKSHCVHLALYCLITSTGLFGTAWSQDEKSDTQALDALIRGTVVDESGSPVASAKIQSLTYKEQDRRQTESLRNGAFVLRIPADSPFGHALLVTDAAGERAGFVGQFSYKVGDRSPLQVVLRPWKTTSVKVIDSQGQSAVGATVYLIADHGELGKTQTDQAGIATLRFPADAKVDWVCGHSHRGRAHSCG